VIERVSPGQWRELRELRLRALADAPYAFASSYAREVGYDEQRWRTGIERVAWFVARAGGRSVGLAAGKPAHNGAPDERELVSMWVEPARRGTGLAGELVAAVREWAAGDGARVLVLWVADGNERARRFYLRLGFASTGLRQPLPGNRAVDEERYAVALTTAGDEPGARRARA
jgi:GNAT superfamily N-acetyltransferase